MWMQDVKSPFGETQPSLYQQPRDGGGYFKPMEIAIVDPLERTAVDQRINRAASPTNIVVSPELCAVDKDTFDSFAADVRVFECKACKRFTTTNRQEMALHVRYYHVFKEGEMEQLITENFEGKLEIVNRYYDHANWVVELRKL